MEFWPHRADKTNFSNGLSTNINISLCQSHLMMFLLSLPKSVNKHVYFLPQTEPVPGFPNLLHTKWLPCGNHMEWFCSP